MCTGITVVCAAPRYDAYHSIAIGGLYDSYRALLCTATICKFC
jgi:hypothetical protein